MHSTIDRTAAAQHSSRIGLMLWVLLGAAVILLSLVIVADVVITHQPQGILPVTSPAGTVQRYLNLLQSGQVDRAFALQRSGITRAHFHAEFDNWSKTSHQVTLVSSTVGRNDASVTVDISSFIAGPFNPPSIESSGNGSRVTFTLSRMGTHWLISGPEYIPGT